MSEDHSGEYDLGTGNLAIGPTASVGLAGAGLAFAIAAYALLGNGPSKNLPLLNPPAPTDFQGRKTVMDFMARSIEILKEGKAKYPHQPYLLLTELGETVVVPEELIEEIKSHPALEFSGPAEVVGPHLACST